MTEHPLGAPRVRAYLDRIGAQRPARPDATALRELHRRHLLTVPFENLSVHLGEPVVLDPEALVDKVVTARRGGFCYELNGAFAALLTALGYPVTLLAGRVFGENGLGAPFDHLALRVDAGGPWLVDVGFGRHTEVPCGWTNAVNRPTPAASSASRRRTTATWTSSGTAGRSTAWRPGRVLSPTSRWPAGGSAPHPSPTSRSPWSAPGSPATAASR